jgi:hypothetical protein
MFGESEVLVMARRSIQEPDGPAKPAKHGRQPEGERKAALTVLLRAFIHIAHNVYYGKLPAADSTYAAR